MPDLVQILSGYAHEAFAIDADGRAPHANVVVQVGRRLECAFLQEQRHCLIDAEVLRQGAARAV